MAMNAVSHSFSFESAQEALGKLERYMEKVKLAEEELKIQNNE